MIAAQDDSCRCGASASCSASVAVGPVLRAGGRRVAEELALMRRIDELHLQYPFYGSRKLLRSSCKRRARGQPQARAAADAAHGARGDRPEAQHERAASRAPGLPVPAAGLAISRPNQVWATDITYIPMDARLRVPGGDHRLVLSRRVLAWRLSNTLDVELLPRGARGGAQPLRASRRSSTPTRARSSRRRLHDAAARARRRGSAWTARGAASTTSSSSGSGGRSSTRRSTCTPTTTWPRPAPASAGTSRFYNDERPHQALGYQTPAAFYRGLDQGQRDVVPSLSRPHKLSVSPWAPSAHVLTRRAYSRQWTLVPVDDDGDSMFSGNLRPEQVAPYAALLMVRRMGSTSTEKASASFWTILSNPEKASASFRTIVSNRKKLPQAFGPFVSNPEKASASFRTIVSNPEKASASFRTIVSNPEKASASFRTIVSNPEKASAVASTIRSNPENASAVVPTVLGYHGNLPPMTSSMFTNRRTLPATSSSMLDQS